MLKSVYLIKSTYENEIDELKVCSVDKNQVPDTAVFTFRRLQIKISFNLLIRNENTNNFK